jgi:putative aldouronate transport system permease protein
MNTNKKEGALIQDANITIINMKPSLLKWILFNKSLYLMLIPGILYYVVFKFVPLFGSIIAFQDYNIFEGIRGSKFVGFKWFSYMFTSSSFLKILFNNLIISFYQIIFSFPAPIVIAILLNELRNMAFKRTIQTVIYLPHFLSWTIVAGLVYMLLSSQTGILNNLLVTWGIVDKPINFLQNPSYVRGIIVLSGMWKECGWNTIIILATLTSISPSLYEAAKIDGAGRWQQCIYITLPGILPAIVTLLLLRVGNIMDLGFESIYPFVNPLTAEKADVFDTYTYVVGVINGQYSMTTAIGLFKSVVSLVLMLGANKISKTTTGESLI